MLLPGIEGDPRVFGRLGALAAEREVIALPLPECSSVEAMAQGLLRGLEGPVVLFGASLGGLVARTAAELEPGRVRGVVALGSLPDPSCRPKGLELASALLARGPEGWTAARYRRRIARRHDEEGVDPELSVLLLASLPAPAVLARRLRAVARWRPAGPPTVPTLWLRGQVDHESPWTTAEAVRWLPGALVETVPGGHRAMLTHPDHLVAIVAHHLRGLDPRR